MSLSWTDHRGRGGRADDIIEMTRSEMEACYEALQRARRASEAAKQLCERASRAFEEEYAVLTRCADTIESYQNRT